MGLSPGEDGEGAAYYAQVSRPSVSGPESLTDSNCLPTGGWTGGKGKRWAA